MCSSVTLVLSTASSSVASPPSLHSPTSRDNLMRQLQLRSSPHRCKHLQAHGEHTWASLAKSGSRSSRLLPQCPNGVSQPSTGAAGRAISRTACSIVKSRPPRRVSRSIPACALLAEPLPTSRVRRSRLPKLTCSARGHSHLSCFSSQLAATLLCTRAGGSTVACSLAPWQLARHKFAVPLVATISILLVVMRPPSWSHCPPPHHRTRASCCSTQT